MKINRFKRIEGTDKIRATSLNVGVEYIINVWYRSSNNKTSPISGVFLGFGKDKDNLTSVVPKLNTASGFLYFESKGKILPFEVKKSAVFTTTLDKQKRVTFSYDEHSYRASYDKKHKPLPEYKMEMVEEKAAETYETDIEDFKDKESNTNYQKKIDIIEEEMKKKYSKEEYETFSKSLIDTFLKNDSETSVVAKYEDKSITTNFDFCFFYNFVLPYKKYYNSLSATKKVNFAKFFGFDYKKFDDKMKFNKQSLLKEKLDELSKLRKKLCLEIDDGNGKMVDIADDENLPKIVADYALYYYVFFTINGFHVANLTSRCYNVIPLKNIS